MKYGFYISRKEAGGWRHFCIKRLRTLKYFKHSRSKLKNHKPIAAHVLIKAYPMVPFSGRSNLAGRYLQMPLFTYKLFILWPE
jgi:hypothetical protein